MNVKKKGHTKHSEWSKANTRYLVVMPAHVSYMKGVSRKERDYQKTLAVPSFAILKTP
jgi:hypothetical protein